ncbi:MAG: hypothetical protein ACRD1Y_00800 [Terriglobales bacterium]
MMSIRRLFTTMSLLASVACLSLFGTSGAILSPTAGTVAVNGQPIAAGSAIVAGDLISTSAAGSARMVLPGGSLVAASKTVFRMENRHGALAIRLDHGLVQVAGFLPVALATRAVVPATSQARFNVYDEAGTVYVEALAGSVALSSAHRITTVPAGTTVSFRDSDSAAAAAASTTHVLTLVLSGVAVGAGIIAIVEASHSQTKTNNVCAQLSPTC